MNNYIINPWWFYLINVITGLKILFIVSAVLCGFAISAYIFCLTMDDEDPFDPKGLLQDLKRLDNYIKDNPARGSELKYDMERIAIVMESVKESVEGNRTIKNRMTIVIIFGIISLLLAVFIPSKETVIQMLLSSQATYENVGIAFEGIKNAADYIINSLKG